MDELDLMIGEVRTRRRPDTPLYVTMAEVMHEFMDEISDETLSALTAVGQQAVRDNGGVGFQEIPVTPETMPVYGFVSLAGEQLMSE
ncbi:MAG: hypothetical protein WEB06_12030 [Actinomycetota bacterium]